MTSQSAFPADRPKWTLRPYRRRTVIIIFFFMASLAYPFSQASNARVRDFVNHVNAFGAPAVQKTKNVAGKARSNASVTPNKWYLWTSPDGDFRLEFPGKPSTKEGIEAPLTIIRAFEVTTSNGMSFSVNFYDLGGDPQAPENNKWSRDAEAISSNADRDAGRRVVQIHRLDKNIIEAEIWQTVTETGTDINYLRQSIVRRGRVYTLACGSVTNRSSVDKPLCRRFFNSMRFISKPSHRAKRR
jgi:hypothetical protein